MPSNEIRGTSPAIPDGGVLKKAAIWGSVITLAALLIIPLRKPLTHDLECDISPVVGVICQAKEGLILQQTFSTDKQQIFLNLRNGGSK